MLGPYAVYIDEHGNWQLLPFDNKGKGGGGGGPGLGSKLPRNVNAAAASAGVAPRASREDHKHDVDTGPPSTVRGPSNAQGVADSLARSDHEHRLELEVESGGLYIGARPRLAFEGAVVVTEDAGGEKVIVRVARDLGIAIVTDPVNVTFAAAVTLVEIELTTEAESIEAHFTGTLIATAESGSVSGGANYWIEVDGTPIDGATGAASVAALAGGITNGASLSMAAHGVVTVSTGTHTIRVRAQAGNATNEPTAGGGGLDLTLSVRQWSAP